MELKHLGNLYDYSLSGHMFSYEMINRIPFLFLQALKFVHRNILRKERNWPYNTNPFSQDLENDEKCLEKFGILTANAKDVRIHQSLVPIWMLLYAPTIQARIYALYMHIYKLPIYSSYIYRFQWIHCIFSFILLPFQK